ncbi:sugar phosphate nucleotidyltransferase [Cytobacillus firmus]|uniref:sugar phosphate nucleotidyltransferase n=1 Tax=Cytobacillus firmus TaxID=1399 RepID=UPI00222838AE|nr:sugar phosphate nucleotidyltransferase [Cytobacillus firmus]
MKGVILAGGTGSRLKPFTQIINKHLLPVGPYPMIYWPIFKLREAGIQEILIITNKKDLSSFFKVLGDGKELRVNLYYEIQRDEGAGIADSLRSAKSFIGEEKFIAILGDNIFKDTLTPYIQSFLKQEKGARVLLKEVKDLSRYGVPQLDDEKKRVKSIIEKPVHPPSSYCVTGIYLYDKRVFQFINAIQTSIRNEFEITDVNNLYAMENKLQYDILHGWWVDAGTHESLHTASQYVNGEKTAEDDIN